METITPQEAAMASQIEYPRIYVALGTARNLKRGYFVGRINAKDTGERLYSCGHRHETAGQALNCAREAWDTVFYADKCPALRAYRSMADIGSTERCGKPIKTERGFCLRHDPILGPKRDKGGRILPKAAR
jgi:hypothetical protein